LLPLFLGVFHATHCNATFKRWSSNSSGDNKYGSDDDVVAVAGAGIWMVGSGGGVPPARTDSLDRLLLLDDRRIFSSFSIFYR
jgi:hypothetical protein